uniref:Phycobiliprotein ApcE n=1 Tax=Membranoptera weeksiae TaxID=158720 RepID=A0A1N7T4F6_9FLOR|nr:phycobillisome linker protein [Membranoptera weeksiae]AHZ94714.1 phycobillisome linker protein [Membranoptera weeksiae]
MIVKANSGSPLVEPKLYQTVSISSIAQAEQQDRFLQLGELNQLVSFFNSGSKRLRIADILAKNANFLVSKAADKIFVGGSPISYLERPQAAFLDIYSSNNTNMGKELLGNASSNLFENLSNSLFNANDSLPPGFKPISVVRYGPVRMKKSLRDLDWFLRYLTYAIVTGDTNLLSVNIRGLRELIDNACSSAAAIVALREMRKLSINIFDNDIEAKQLVQEYFNVVISEFEAPSLSDKLRKRESHDLQGLRLPQIYMNAGLSIQKFVMKSSLSIDEKIIVIQACYRQVFERDISKAYNLNLSDLESQVKIGQLSVKEFIRSLAKSSIYRKQFYEPFVNSRVLELAFRHCLGRGPSSIEEFQKYFSVLSNRGLDGLIDSLINSDEYADYFGEETVPYLRSLGEEALESKNWGAQIRLFNYSAVFRKIPEFITLFSDYKQSLPDQHPYGLSNDPLSIQFGAIFPNNLVNLKIKSAFFTKDTRRILLRCGPSIYNQISRPDLRQLNPGSLGPKVFNLITNKETKFESIDTIIKALYLRVFGRLVYQEELSNLVKFENQFRNQVISIRSFIRLIVKSNLFRSLYWDPFYICKAIEYIHNKLIGRPTYGRQEINQYFDIAYKKGYYRMVDSMIDSQEYIESFGDNIIPYERYITSSTALSRNLFTKINKSKFENIYNNNETINKTNFVILGEIKEKRSLNNIIQRINQGVSQRRDQTKIFKIISNVTSDGRIQVLRAIYRQLFERDLNSFTIGDEFYNLEKAFLVGDLTVQQTIEKLGSSLLYRKEFYQPHPNTKVIELGTKHFLGRAPNNQAEIRYYNQILASQGISYFISILVNSSEYNIVFGSDIVPYRRFPTLPAANFPNTEKLYNTFTKQNESIIVPSFK